MTLQTLVLRYAFFAILATLANLATQRGVLWFSDSGTVFALALVAGTIVGLVLKYILDKRWIFCDMSVGVKAQSKRFSLYTACSGVRANINHYHRIQPSDSKPASSSRASRYCNHRNEQYISWCKQ